jgi:hypothetical protein
VSRARVAADGAAAVEAAVAEVVCCGCNASLAFGPTRRRPRTFRFNPSSHTSCPDTAHPASARLRFIVETIEKKAK